MGLMLPKITPHSDFRIESYFMLSINECASGWAEELSYQALSTFFE